MEVRKNRNVESCRYVNIEIWKCGHREIQSHGNLEVLKIQKWGNKENRDTCRYGNMKMEQQGNRNLEIWIQGNMVAWKSGSVENMEMGK